jgi:hypothetical protein
MSFARDNTVEESALRRILTRRLLGHQPIEGDPPLRAELFNIEQLRHHAKDLSARHGLDDRHHRDRLLSRLDDNERVLLHAYSRITNAVRAKRDITPAGEWLLDNFHVIEEQIALARRHFPKSYSRELPRLRGGPNAGHHRVYEIALELISHVDGRVDAETSPRLWTRIVRCDARSRRIVGHRHHASARPH